MILNFEEIKEEDIVGNKAKFLALMQREGFNIPNGFVLDVNTYIEIINENKIKFKIEEELNSLNENNIDIISENINRLFDIVSQLSGNLSFFSLFISSLYFGLDNLYLKMD